MKAICKVIAMALLVTVVSPTVPAYGFSQHAQQKPASCHEHGQKAPAPGPATYQCCRGGHQFAVVREATNLRLPVVSSSRLVELVVPASADFNRGRPSNPRMVASGPPAATSLRI